MRISFPPLCWMQDEKPGLLSCSSPPGSALEMLASLVGQQYAAVAKLLKGAIGSESHDCVRVRGFSQREVHHFWAEGLAISMERGRVYLVEAFGDDHPFHRRAPNAELYPSLFFGASSAEARKILGEPSDEFADSGWLRYTDWPQRDTGCLGGGKRTHTTLALQFNEAKEGEKGEKGEKGIQGPPGVEGVHGPKGDTGDQGERGETGVTGADGKSAWRNKGDYEEGVDYHPGDYVAWHGSIYIKMREGKASNTWEKLNGPAGPHGRRGPRGYRGDLGPQGYRGIQGIQGEKGDKGDIGVQGITGPQGIQGNTGIQGVQGVHGVPGQDGGAGGESP